MTMNHDLHQLKLLRHRIDRLRDIYYSLLNTPVPIEDWKTWLDRFVALQAQYQAFWRELADEKLAMLLLQPEQTNSKIPDVLLRTQMDPEIESQLESLTNSIDNKSFDTTRLLNKLQELDEQFADELAALSSGSELLE